MIEKKSASFYALSERRNIMVTKWMSEFSQANPKTKWFIFNWAIYGIAIIVTTVYCYARLNFVRSYKIEEPKKEEISNRL